MASLLDTDMVLLEVEAATREEVINRLAALFAVKGRVSDTEEYVKSVLEREALFSTAVGEGVAIPHGKSAVVKQVSIAVGRLKTAMLWGDSEEAVKIVFLLAIPEFAAGKQHLRILAELSGRLMDEEFCEKIMALKQEQEIVKLLGFAAANVQ